MKDRALSVSGRGRWCGPRAMGSHVHRTSIGITGCHRPLRGQCLNSSDRPSGSQDLLANLTQLRVRSHAQPPPSSAKGVEISGRGGRGFDDHQVVVPTDIDDCNPWIRGSCRALEREGCSEQFCVVGDEPVEVGRGQSQMVDSEEIGHGEATVGGRRTVPGADWAPQPTQGGWPCAGRLRHSMCADGSRPDVRIQLLAPVRLSKRRKATSWRHCADAFRLLSSRRRHGAAGSVTPGCAVSQAPVMR